MDGFPAISCGGGADDEMRLLTVILPVLSASAPPLQDGDEARLDRPSSGDAPASVSAGSGELRDGEKYQEDADGREVQIERKE